MFYFAAKVDLDNELVRHFLIETTKKGVRLKGYNDEPVFGKFWLNTTHLFDGSLAANCLLLKDAHVASEPVKDEVSCGRRNRKDNNVGMDFKKTHGKLKELV